MADFADSVDITTDLNGQGSDAQPYHGNDLPPSQVQPDRQSQETSPDAPKSLRDTLSDAFNGEKAPEVPQTQQPAPQAAEGRPEGPELVKVGERFHRKDGSFASKEEIDAYNAAQVPEGQAPPVTVPDWAQGLTEVERQQFTALPAEIRQFVERTMEGVNQRGAQYNEYSMIEQVLGPRRQAWAAEGMNPTVALNQLFALSDFAGRDPGEFVLWFADQHRLDLDMLLDARDAANAEGNNNPQIAGLQQEIAQLRNTINGFTTSTQQQQQAQNFQQVVAFKAEKDAQGNLLHPYFDDVATDIANHVALIRQQQPFLSERDVLQAAYDFATYNNVAVRGRIQQSQAEAERNRQAAEAARARQVGVSVSGGPAGDISQQPNTANRTLRDTLIHAYNQSTLN